MKRLSFILILILFLLLPINVQAKDYSKSLNTVSFSTLSDSDMEDTINSLVSKISRELARFNSDGTGKLDAATMPAAGYIVFGSIIIQ